MVIPCNARDEHSITVVPTNRFYACAFILELPGSFHIPTGTLSPHCCRSNYGQFHFIFRKKILRGIFKRGAHKSIFSQKMVVSAPKCRASTHSRRSFRPSQFPGSRRRWRAQNQPTYPAVIKFQSAYPALIRCRLVALVPGSRTVVFRPRPEACSGCKARDKNFAGSVFTPNIPAAHTRRSRRELFSFPPVVTACYRQVGLVPASYAVLSPPPPVACSARNRLDKNFAGSKKKNSRGHYPAMAGTPSSRHACSYSVLQAGRPGSSVSFSDVPAAAASL
jgi:hypothetical protein